MDELECFHCHFKNHKFCTSAVQMEAIFTGFCRKFRTTITMDPQWKKSQDDLDQMLWMGLGITLTRKRMEEE